MAQSPRPRRRNLEAEEPVFFAILGEAIFRAQRQIVGQHRFNTGTVVVEWDAYRYTPTKRDNPGVILYGISRRAYGETDGRTFLTTLKDQRANTTRR